MMRHDDIAAMRATIDMLTEENRQLREQLNGDNEWLPDEPHLSKTEGKILRLLMARNTVNRDTVFDSLYGDRSDADQPDFKTLDVCVCKLRKKLAPYGVVIATVWGEGYRLTDKGKTLLRTMAGEDTGTGGGAGDAGEARNGGI